MKKYIVIGNPIDHSLSPKLHNYWLKENNIDVVKWNIEQFNYNESAKKFELNTGVDKASLGDPISSFNYTFKRIGSSQFIRFMITVIIDVIISTVIYSVIRRHLREKGMYHEKKSNLKTGNFLKLVTISVDVFPTLLYAP